MVAFAVWGYNSGDPSVAEGTRFLSGLEAIGRLAQVGTEWASYASPVAGSGRRAVAQEVAEEASERLVRKSLPPLSEDLAKAFEGPIKARTLKAGTQIYRSPNLREGVLEPVQKPRRWFGTRLVKTKAALDQLYNVSPYGNPMVEMRVYKVTKDVTVYYGRVAGGKGYQIYIPGDITPQDVLEYVTSIPLR